jgi:hypothetical protein
MGFLGTKLHGLGFLIGGEREFFSPSVVDLLLNEEKIFIKPYIGGEDLNRQPRPAFPHRVVDVSEINTEEDLSRLTLFGELSRTVRPTRALLQGRLKSHWWIFGSRAQSLYLNVDYGAKVVVTAAVSNTFGFEIYDFIGVFKIVVFKSHKLFPVLQSRCHEIWCRMFGSR